MLLAIPIFGLQDHGLQPFFVSGMVKGKMKLYSAEIMRELKASGYKVSARLMNPMYFGVLQSRERISNEISRMAKELSSAGL